MKDEKWREALEKDVGIILMQHFSRMAMSTPDNFNRIVKYCADDVEECADEEYSDGDITIAFRRFIESMPAEEVNEYDRWPYSVLHATDYVLFNIRKNDVMRWDNNRHGMDIIIYGDREEAQQDERDGYVAISCHSLPAEWSEELADQVRRNGR